MTARPPSPRPLSLTLYALATWAAEPLTPWLLRRRAGLGKEDAERLGERRGVAGRARPPGPLVWLHGSSVGEALSMAPLIDRIAARRPDLTILVTTGTRTSAQVLSGRLPARVIHQFAPLDTPQSARRFLAHWRPGLAIFVESELWPNLLLAVKASGARLALVSARITADSARGWSRAASAARAVIGAFDLILAQDEAVRGRLEALGGRFDGYLNLKDAADPLPAGDAALPELRQQIQARPVILAASTHLGEEELIAAAVRALDGPHAPLLLIAPRHPERADGIAAALGDTGLARRSLGETIEPDTGVYLADTLGEMGLFYRLADVTVMGGGLVEGVGGHNPLEPARLGAAIVSGRHVANFQAIYEEMAAAGCVLQVGGPGALTAILHDLLADPQRRSGLGEAARRFALARRGDFEAAWTKLQPMLPA